MRECQSTVNVARDWLKGMGDAALAQNFSIQYCTNCDFKCRLISIFLLKMKK